MPIKFSRQTFATQVEELVAGGAGYLDAIQTVCDNNDIDVEAAKAYISPVLMEKVTLEARKLRLLDEDPNTISTGRLPI